MSVYTGFFFTSQDATMTQLERHAHPAQCYLALGARLRIQDIPHFGEQKVPVLFAELERLQLTPLAPLTFIYQCGSDDSQDMQIWLVLAVAQATGEPQQGCCFIDFPAYEYVSLEHPGSMLEIRASWQKLVSQAQQQGLALTPYSREIYHHWVDFDSPDNRTELQLQLG